MKGGSAVTSECVLCVCWQNNIRRLSKGRNFRLSGCPVSILPLKSIQSLSLTVRCVQKRYVPKFWQLLTIAVDVLLNHDIARPKCTDKQINTGRSRYDYRSQEIHDQFVFSTGCPVSIFTVRINSKSFPDCTLRTRKVPTQILTTVDNRRGRLADVCLTVSLSYRDWPRGITQRGQRTVSSETCIF